MISVHGTETLFTMRFEILGLASRLNGLKKLPKFFNFVVVRDSSLNMTRGGNEDIAVGLRKTILGLGGAGEV